MAITTESTLVDGLIRVEDRRVATTHFNPDTKQAGDLIRAEDWNATTAEVVRLEADKLDRTGTPELSGNLTLTGSLGVGTDEPDNKVTLKDSENCFLSVRADDEDGGKEVLIGADDEGAIVSAKTDHDLVLRAGGNDEKVRIKADGKVGIGTDDPDSTLHVTGTEEPVIKLQSKISTKYSGRLALRAHNERGADLYCDYRGQRLKEAFVIATNSESGQGGEGMATAVRLAIGIYTGYVGIGKRQPKHLLDMKGDAYCNGVSWVQSCSRESKTGVKSLALEAAQEALAALDPVTFRYREGDGHDRVGFIAEDVPELVAQPDRKGLSPMDILAVVTRVVQDQQREIEDLRAQVTALAATGTA